MSKPIPDKMHLRRKEVLELTEISNYELKQLVATKVLTPVYLRKNGRPYYSTKEVVEKLIKTFQK